MSSIFRRYSTSARLGDLLVQAGVLAPDQLQDAIKVSKEKKLQIGQVLVIQGLLTPKDLQLALEAQSALRDKTIDINIAVQCIKVARKIGASFADVLEDYDKEAAKRARTGRLGELLLEAGVINLDDLSKSMEQALNNSMPLGRMLVLNNVIAAEVLEKSLEIQVRLRDEMMTREEAMESLRSVAGIKQAPAKDEPGDKKQKVRLGELLVMAGVLNESDVMDALEWGIANQQPIGNVLVSKGLISKELLNGALFFQQKVREGELDPLKACECLSEVFSTGVTPEEALAEVSAEPSPDAPAKPPIDYQTLVTLARVVSDDEIEKAFKITQSNAALIGKMLVLTGFMDVPTLQATLRCYQMVAKGWLAKDDAIAALDYCLHQDPNAPLSFEQALRDLQWTPEGGLKMKGEKIVLKEAVRRASAEIEKPKVDTTKVDSVEKEEPAPATTPEKIEESAPEKADEKEAEKDEQTGPSVKDTPAEVEPAVTDDTTGPLPAIQDTVLDGPLSPKEEPRPAEKEEPEPTAKKKTEPAEKKEPEPTEKKKTEPAEEKEPEPTAKKKTEPAEEKEPEPTAKKKPEPAEKKEPEPTAKKKTEPAEKKEPEPTAKKKPEPAEKKEPEPTAKKKTEPAEKKEPEPTAKKEPEPTAKKKTEPAEKKEPEPSSSEKSAIINSEPEGPVGLSALLSPLKQSDESQETEKPKKSIGGTLGALVAKSKAQDPKPAAEESAKTETPSEPKKVSEAEKQKAAAAPKKEAPAKKPPEKKVPEEKQPAKGKLTSDEEIVEELSKLSAVELLEQIVQSSNDAHMSAKGKKRKGRFSETILPEAAKAKQLATLLGQESERLAEKFKQSGENPDALGTAFTRLAESHFTQGNYKEAQVLYERILVHKLNDGGPENLDLVEDYNNLAMTLCVQGNFDKAEPFMRRAVTLYETSETQEPAALADYLHSLGTIVYRLEKYSEAEELIKKVIEIRRQELSDTHPDIGRTLTDYARVVKKLGHKEKAEAIYKKAQEILKGQ